MTDERSYLPWPGADDRRVVEEMLTDGRSAQWDECRKFIRKWVQRQATNIPPDYWDDIVQDTSLRVARYLHAFQYQCSLKTWLFSVIRNSIIDFHRKFSRGQHIIRLGDSSEDIEYEEDIVHARNHLSMEEEFLIREDLKKTLAVLEEYLSEHKKPERNQQILSMVLLGNQSLVEVAQEVGCSEAVASYVVRSAQRYVREKLKDQR
jgi:RNA polymerase sigma factor (sigma-70 family)